MNSKYYFITALWAIAALYGCTETVISNSSTFEPPIEEDESKPECESGEDCDSGECVSGVCALKVGAGSECHMTQLCQDGLECVEGTCQTKKPVVQEDECNNVNKPCPEGQICIAKKCEDIVMLGKGEACTFGDYQRVCADPMICHEGKCQKDQSDFTCASDDDCDHQEVYRTCVEGQCKKYVQPGSMCDSRNLCADGATCYMSVCMMLAAEDEACSQKDWLACDILNGYQCIDNICRYVTDRQVVGGDCDEYKQCSSELVCLNGKCMTPGLEGDACDEAEFTTCTNGMMCILGECIPVSGACQKSEDCTEKDSYCCQSETCGAVGYCIPYDETTTHDDMCLFKTKPGIFEAQIQCRWTAPNDAYPKSTKVEMMPLVGHFGNKADLKTVVAFYSYDTEGNIASSSVIRFIHPETCETLESIPQSSAARWSNYPLAADLDGDGLMEFMMSDSSGKVVAYKWDAEQKKHKLYWTSEVAAGGTPLVYDIDNDGKPEILSNLTVLNHLGKKIYNSGGSGSNTFAVGNFDQDPNGIASLLRSNGIYKWDVTNKKWVQKLSMEGQGHTAYADFGTPGDTVADFDFTKLDGYPEFVFSGGNKLRMYAAHTKSDGKLEAQLLMDVRGYTTGGPVTIGDFNNDGLPEIGIASSGLFGVYDLKCKAYEEGKCADKHVMWERWSQDNSSGATGSSLFDFDGDGQTEAVYADECYIRVYDGKNGRILFSAPRSSYTSIEGPVIADIDDDGSSEILMGSDYHYSCYNDGSGGKVLAGVDPIHEGIRCMDDEDCPTSKNCNKEIGLCICNTDADCNTQHIGGEVFKQYACTSPIHEKVGFKHNPTNASSRTLIKDRGARPDGWQSGDYKVCRAWRDTNTGARQAGVGDLMIYKDRLDRWVSSRNMWNQHAYNIINIQDDGQVPSNAIWMENWLLKKVGEFVTGSTTQERPKYNNYRMNEQGLYGAGTVPDITGRFILGNICGETEDGRKVISGKLCNRGTKPVATNLPATFFYYDETAPNHRGEPICTSYTPGIVGVGECQHVGCTVEESIFEELQGKKVLMVTNLNEHGFASTVECNESNNTDTVTIDKCEADIEIVN